jgi:hypothetical protein
VAGPSGFGAISTPYLGFGVKFVDLDNDGWADIFVANGHVNPQVDRHSFGVSYAERPLVFHNLKNGKLEELGLRTGEALSRRYVGRGLVSADFGNHGREDLLMTVLDGSPVLLRNRSTAGNWLLLKMIGTPSNRDGFGARVELKAGSLMQDAEVRANSSFESASDPRLHFGLGEANRVDKITIHWPSGKVESVGPESGDQELVIKEGSGVIRRIHPPALKNRQGAG